jgi:hypothetical protein
MATRAADFFDVQSAPRGPRWIGWIVRKGEQVPYRSVVLVAASREEAEARARAWADTQIPVAATPVPDADTQAGH